MNAIMVKKSRFTTKMSYKIVGLDSASAGRLKFWNGGHDHRRPLRRRRRRFLRHGTILQHGVDEHDRAQSIRDGHETAGIGRSAFFGLVGFIIVGKGCVGCRERGDVGCITAERTWPWAFPRGGNAVCQDTLCSVDVALVAIPKSVILTCPSVFTSMFCGLISR